MLFNSISFGIFLPIVFMIYWFIPHKYRWFILLSASYYFYACWNVKYILLILMTTVVSYSTAILIEKAQSKRIKNLCLVSALTVCFGILFFFKYFNFFAGILSVGFRFVSITLHPVTLNLLLPVGISFYTFQTLSYVIDVYKGHIAAEYHFGYYATFISFFPQLVAGPIERTENLLPQIKGKHSFEYSKATYGLKLMAWGYLKKLVIADVLSAYVDKIYNSPFEYKGFVFIVATFFFTIQIYCDFSGYSDIAIGTAKLLGIDLMTNFRSPYLSASIREFWSRWHISLSTWFRDYVYIPLGGNRKGEFHRNINLLITFLVSGLWHGANWTFVVWGGVHGVAQILEYRLQKYKEKWSLKRPVRIFLVFLFSCFAWIFFRANSLYDAKYILSNMFIGISSPIAYIGEALLILNIDILSSLKIIFSLIMLLLYDYYSLKRDVIKGISTKIAFVRYFVYFGIIAIILCFRAGTGAVFVYFQF